MNPFLRLLILGVLTLPLIACNSYAVKNATPVAEVAGVSDIDPEYLIQVGDVVRVSLRTYDDPLNPEVTEVPVRPDGKVFFPLIDDEVLLAGYTPSSVRDILVEKYSEIIRDPNLTVNITSFGNRSIYVAGEVRDIRERFEFARGMTALRAVAAVGYDTYRASLDNVIVIRQAGNGNPPHVIQLNLDNALTNVDSSQDIMLRPNDVVFVPTRGIVQAGDVIARVNALVPLPGITYPVGSAALIDHWNIGD